MNLTAAERGWISVASEKFFPPAFEPATVVPDTADPNVRALYVPTDDVVVTDTSVSIAVIDGGCSVHMQKFFWVSRPRS